MLAEKHVRSKIRMYSIIHLARHSDTEERFRPVQIASDLLAIECQKFRDSKVLFGVEGSCVNLHSRC